jgi:hypothetical protein
MQMYKIAAGTQAFIVSHKVGQRAWTVRENVHFTRDDIVLDRVRLHNSRIANRDWTTAFPDIDPIIQITMEAQVGLGQMVIAKPSGERLCFLVVNEADAVPLCE